MGLYCGRRKLTAIYRSFFAGSLPLSFSLSPRQLRFITTIGTGVLVGTALIVIIPEGVETLYNSVSIQDQKTLVPERLANPLKGAVAKAGLHKLPLPDDIRRDSIDEGEDITSIALLKRDFSLSPNPTNSRTLHVRDEGEHDDKSSPHAWVGISLISGFILMYLIDTLPPLSSTPSPAPQHISLHELGSSEPSSAAVAQPPSNNHHSSATTIGLLIHAAADGIALGAALAAPTANAALGPAVFAAIMLHKAPVAFGLAAALLRQRRAKRAVRAHLAVFSLAAPAGAVVTWFLVGLVGGVGTKAADGAWWTGVVLVFSGGTFL